MEDLVILPPPPQPQPLPSHSQTPSNGHDGGPDQEASIDVRKRFGDCALVEIIHLHDCLRGAIHALEKDLTDLSTIVLSDDFEDLSNNNNNNKNKSDPESSSHANAADNDDKKPSPCNATSTTTPTTISQSERLVELESRSNARFQVIWSVFRAHSAAEDEFIWPALRSKTKGKITGSPPNSPEHNPNSDDDIVVGDNANSISNNSNGNKDNSSDTNDDQPVMSSTSGTDKPAAPACAGDQETSATAAASSSSSSGYESATSEIVEQEEYEEDHADEERMFTMMDHLLNRLRKGLHPPQQLEGRKRSRFSRDNVVNTMKEILSLTKTLTQHLFVHLEKEENQCLPLVVKHMTKPEIHDLVGQIMGKRSSDMIAQILTMAVQNLDEVDQEGMVKHMKQAMAGTYFDQWLSMTGWMDGKSKRARAASIGTENEVTKTGDTVPGADNNGTIATAADSSIQTEAKRLKSDTSFNQSSYDSAHSVSIVASQHPTSSSSTTVTAATATIRSHEPSKAGITPSGETTSHSELEKLIRAVATNQSLTAVEKQSTIQGLRASVWKRNKRLLSGDGQLVVSVAQTTGRPDSSSKTAANLHPPAAYYVMGTDENMYCVEDPALIPTFTKKELAATYNDSVSTTGQVLGCPHYARGCKLRHPVSGRLHTCRICCEQKREAATTAPGDQEPPLDRFSVKEVMCMECTTLQPASKRCIKPDCSLHKKEDGFARYYCGICNLYDNRPSVSIFHCPYCNTCRLGEGLGIDYRHCMRCNACVSMTEEHRCIPQKLQGSCPICHETLFNSTEALRGLQCGHVMHLSCFNDYRRGQNYTCPLCMRCMEDMTEYFSLLDQAVTMQAMPPELLNTKSNIYCQDCEKTGQCSFHFVGLKCPSCGSYNTREMNRLQPAPS